MAVTADGRGHAELTSPSLRHREANRTIAAGPLAWVIVAGIVVLGGPLVTQRWFGGDLLYHSGLSTAILRGEFLPGGPYEGLPSYYPPGFHAVVAAIMATLGTTFETAIRLLTLVSLPILPIGTFALTRRLTGRHVVALLATVLTLFGGGLDLSADRTWVNSLFVSGQASAPIYPRDLVFGVLPWAMLAAVVSFEATGSPGRRYLGLAAVAGVLLGLAGLVQVQLLLPVPIGLLTLAVALGIRRPADRLRLAVAVGTIGALALAVILPWIVAIAGAIVRNGGVSLESSEALVPVRLGFWDLPRQFGFILPAGLIGGGVALLFMKESRGPRPPDETANRWRPSTPEAPTLLVGWALVPFVLAFAYSPAWPLEDALRPQRLFLLASQPIAILAAIGFVTVAEDLRARWRRPRAVAAGVAAAVLVSTVPTATVTAYRAATAFATPAYAHLELAEDRVPDFRTIVPAGPGRSRLLTYEDWSALAWYETAAQVVALKPPGYSKLAFDPEIFTGVSQPDRRRALALAFAGDPAALASVADRFEAELIVLAKSEGLWGTIDQTAAVVPLLDPTAVRGRWSVLDGNGWDAIRLESDASVTFPTLDGGFVDVSMRVQSARDRGRSSMRLAAVGLDGTSRTLFEGPVERAGRLEGWPVIEWFGYVAPDERLRVEAGAALYVQSLRGYVEAPPVPAGWILRTDTPDYVVLERR